MKCTLPKNFCCISLLIPFLFSLEGKAQGPISPTGLIGQKEIVMVWDEGSSASSNTVNQQVAKLITGYEGQPDVSKRYEFSAKKTENDGNYGDRQLSVAAGDFNGDDIDEYVVATRAASNQILLRIPHLDKSTLSYTTSETKLVGSNVDDGSDIRVLAGNFDDDSKDEIILAYKDKNQLLHIELYDTDDNLVPTLTAHIEDETLVSTSGNNDWGIAIHDLDGDSKDEVMIAFRPSTPGQGVFAKVYKLNGTSFTAKARKLIDNNPLTNKSYNIRMSIGAGDFNHNGKQEIALAWGRMDSCGGIGCNDTFIYPLEIGDDTNTSEKDSLEAITFNPDNRGVTNLSPNDPSPIDLQTGDLNGDGQDEIVVAGSRGAEVFEADNNLKLTRKSNDTYYYDELGYSVDYMRVSDIDGKPGDEITILDHYFDQDPGGNQYFTLSVYGFDSNLNSSVIAHKSNIQTISNGSGNISRSHYAVATGDFNGDNFRIGEGKKYIKTDIIQPLVILNAPPTHFDVLGDKTYDINSCYNANLANCGQTATYFKSTSETQMVNTEIHSDWGVSSTLSGDGSFLGIGVKAHLTATYGEKFSKTQNNSTTVNVSTEVTASGDDLIYATVCDYEIWEYPVYTANNTKNGYVIAVVPKLTENRWFPSKERSADGYIPKHEVGNILSYTPYANLNNPDQEQSLRGSYTNGSFDLNESTNATFEVNFANTFSNTDTRQKDIGLEVGASVSGWGVELSGTATYNQGEITTHTTTIESNVDAKVHLGPIDRSLGEDNFNVTPYVYWAKNGALVIDYAARAILPSAGGTATWWSQNYGQEQDPAFILPWRLDPEKGLALQDEARRQQTKSISFEPREPNPGDTVTITAVINNFSLKQTDDSVPVSFYLGDPNNGGTILSDLKGQTIFKTPGKIPAQGYLEASMKWKMPSGLDPFPRIYAYIDPKNVMSEIHENNNIGWRVMGKSDFTSGVETLKGTSTNTESLSHVYPNPFNSNSILQYEVPETSAVNINIYDLQGRLLKVLVNEHKTKGIYTVDIDGSNLVPGIYVYRYSAGNHVEYKRMVKIK